MGAGATCEGRCWLLCAASGRAGKGTAPVSDRVGKGSRGATFGWQGTVSPGGGEAPCHPAEGNVRLWPRKRLLFARPNREMHFTLYKRLRCLVRIVICVCVRACTCVREWCMCERARVRACLRGLWVWHSGTKSVLGECERLGERGEGRESKRGWRECRRGEEGRGGECLCRPRVPSGPCWDLRPPVNTARPGGERRGGGGCFEKGERTTCLWRRWGHRKETPTRLCCSELSCAIPPRPRALRPRRPSCPSFGKDGGGEARILRISDPL